MTSLRQRLLRPLRRLPHGPVIRLSPPEILLLGFVLLSCVGTLLLLLPIAARESLAWHQAFFTATSAMTVTGLTVVDTASFTLFGQLVILSLIQLGGIGFMIFAALTLILLGMRLPLRQQSVIQENLNYTSYRDLLHLVRLVVAFALVAEVIGTGLLALAWVPRYGLAEGLWVSFFHAVSAFNNAGFSTWSESLVADVANPIVNITISLLFVIGGLGFIVVAELIERRRIRRVSLHARVVLHATFWLALVGMLLFLLLEWHNPATLGGLESLPARLQAAWFHSVTPRTAGFNTLDTGSLKEPTALMTMLLMFIGAGSGSTASGIKVTTFVVMLLVARSFFRGGAQPTVFHQSLSDMTVFKAVAVALSGMLLIFTCLFVLTITEPGKDFLALAFESVSAFGTVGLSRGITAELSLAGQATIMVTMLLGRAGPISLGYFIATRQTKGLKYAKGTVHIG
ncbi:TrkH family potassium uptake protein [Halomonas daqiaonensis]|uniref:Trk system potassium uptake protein TrkH n=1 Tax=Halomonas daqiaonensis TaxID=650850 RepID=A0A1H7WBY7_9GAMM|nr:TrkH family potassium uptake protein [Halomonas daqiaonensis]SEM19102.1 trk system potassium uptake protein TrkH [Halomonas daqiaonensis]